MSVWHAILLGLVQGVTEFLPISSSGHLIIVQHVLGYTNELISFDILLHLATLIAILVYFNFRLVILIRTHWKFLVIATIPAVIAGIGLDSIAEQLFGSLMGVAFGLLITATLLYLSQKVRITLVHSKLAKTLWVGMFQALAIFPGISRSGATISAARMVGYDVDEAFDLSFLLSIPIIIGAVVFQFASMEKEVVIMIDPAWYMGMISAAIMGILSLLILRRLLSKNKLHYFASYCLAVSLLLLVMA